jgi:predicted secreted hydrolase
MKKPFVALSLLSLLLSCSLNNNITYTPENLTQSESIDAPENSRSDFLEQGNTVLNKYPETRKLFLDWKPESQEALKFKQELAEQLLKSKSGNIAPAELEKILSEKPRFNTEAKKPINFATDQGEHKNKLSEWWYYNGHLNSQAGESYGYELCLFRVTPLIYFVHIAVTDEKNKKFHFVREYFTPSKVKTSTVQGDISYGSIAGTEQNGEFKYNIHGAVENFSLDLNLQLKKQPLLFSGTGLVDMPEGTDSYYYSLTHLETTGTLTKDGKSTPVKGISWMDHQWGNFVAYFVGWDWFSLQMNDNTEYNLVASRDGNGNKLQEYVNIFDPNSNASYAKQLDIKRLDWWTSPDTGKLYANKWELKLPASGETFLIEPTVPGQELFRRKIYDIPKPYWEGSCKVTKILPDGKTVQGVGYVEQFPYKFQIQ